jgi:hypothetical protein
MDYLVYKKYVLGDKRRKSKKFRRTPIFSPSMKQIKILDY